MKLRPLVWMALPCRLKSLAGAAYGAGNVAAYRRAIRLTTEAAILLAIGWTGLFWVFGPLLVDLMTDKPEIRFETKNLLIWAVVSPLMGVLAYQLDGLYFG